ncbi:DNA-binding domain-containing protein [Cognatilysobacter terrigena]|uniref:HvfC family RiPP maturation protein n=1 Tax=Cognatilysobacter terrigena TaxID=2488749 RepID=UPI001061A5D2|nr:putative DNA-binding domain-containing protein [Lysobacter terrigena]
MPPESFDSLDALAAYVRDPERATAPVDIEARRLKVYADLVFNNVESLLAGTFPVTRATLGDAWRVLIRDFLREHDARTPVFTELPRELLRYLDARADAARSDPPWLRELAHYEWVELALQISDESPARIPHDPHGDLRNGVPVVSPLAWPLAYDWPVERIAPGAVPESPEPTLLLVHRHDDGSVGFHALSLLAFHLLQRLIDVPAATGDTHLRALAHEVAAPDVEAFVDAGIALLEDYRRDRIVLGTRAAG